MADPPNDKTIEIHPFEPFIDRQTRLLIMGTFPPPKARWSMDFYYPNRTNDFWYMMGLIFYGDKMSLLCPGTKNFDLDKIKNLLLEKHIGLNDTGYKIYRAKGNASDKFLEIIEPVPLFSLLERMPACRAVATTGEKAADVVASLTGTVAPRMGEMSRAIVQTSPDAPMREIDAWRMPSTSRAYPLALEKKAAYYRKLFESVGII